MSQSQGWLGAGFMKRVCMLGQQPCRYLRLRPGGTPRCIWYSESLQYTEGYVARCETCLAEDTKRKGGAT